jgi:hypothetical protein
MSRGAAQPNRSSSPDATPQQGDGRLDLANALHPHRLHGPDPPGHLPGVPRTLRRAVFLDRDGTLVEEVPYLHDPAEVALLPGVAGRRPPVGAAAFPSLAAAADAVLQGPREPGPPRP